MHCMIWNSERGWGPNPSCIMSHVATRKAHLIPESVSVHKQAMLVRSSHKA